MSSREWMFRIEDILSSLERISQYIHEIDLDKFKLDQRTIDAVVRNLEIMGEAARHIPHSVTQKYSEIPWKYMMGMRNILIHEYFGINTDIIWHTIKYDLPPLRSQLEEIMRDKQSA